MLNREEALKLFEENMGLAYFAAKRYAGLFDGCAEAGREDALQLCRLGLWIAACGFDAARGTRFSTYAYACMSRQVSNLWRQLKRHANLATLPILAEDDEPEAISERCLAMPGDMENEICCALLMEQLGDAGAGQWKRALKKSLDKPVERPEGRFRNGA